MKTFKARELVTQFQLGDICQSNACDNERCNEEYVLLKDAQEECKNLWDINNNLRGAKADAELVAKEKSLAVTLLTNKNTIANRKLAATELQLKDKSGALDIVRGQRADAWKTNRELRQRLFNADNTVTDLRARLEAAEAQLKYGYAPYKYPQIDQFAGVGGPKFYRALSEQDFRVNSRNEVCVPVADLQALERKLTDTEAQSDSYRLGVQEKQNIILTLQAELRETQAGILKRDFARDCYYITGDRWHELHRTEREAKAQDTVIRNMGNMIDEYQGQIRTLKSEENNSQKIIDAQATVIRNQKVELQKMAAELVMAKPFFVVSGVKIVPNAFVAPGQVIGINAPETVIYPFEDPYYSLMRKLAAALDAQPGEDIVAVAQQTREHKNSYKAILVEIRKALGVEKVSPGTEIIALAKLARASNEQLRERNDNQYAQIQRLRAALETVGEAATQFVNKPYVANKLFDEAMDLFWTIERTIKNTQPTTGASTAPGNSR